ncbi:hypothetical protein WS68_05725, partial [Burkholderia sp. TSV86]
MPAFHSNSSNQPNNLEIFFMAILRTPHSRIAAAVLVVVAAGLGAFGAIRVNASSADKAQAPLTEVDVAGVLSKTVTDWQS